jgi:hypothetical protein
MAFAAFPTCTTDVNSGRLRRKMANTETQFLCTSLLDLLALAWVPSAVSFFSRSSRSVPLDPGHLKDGILRDRPWDPYFFVMSMLIPFFNNIRDAKRALAGSFLIQGLQKVPSGFDIPNSVNRIEV